MKYYRLTKTCQFREVTESYYKQLIAESNEIYGQSIVLTLDVPQFKSVVFAPSLVFVPYQFFRLGAGSRPIDINLLKP